MPSETSALFLPERSNDMPSAQCGELSAGWRALACPRMRSGSFFAYSSRKSVTDPDRRGCLIVNSALEVSAHDAELGKLIASYLDEIEAFFRRCLRRGQDSGEINKNINFRDTARLLLGVVLGIRVAARSRPERALLEGMVRPALALLDLPLRRRLKGKP